ncbi:unnamed protein product [Bursaphelenchus okinawaensis]|uniref:ShKT domain-containing protein n=1 Tax=Bursaphelenchus okinawaensis TaxID=465554 RepID=A0A811L6K1_9BILA|nr:unnamed protein product [Bursaphelenchus okinawaensis]CAG9117569.1 unnamed protein product [Bursaphelenchus okinawaensis]
MCLYNFLVTFFVITSLINQVDGQCANALGPCIGGECPDQEDAGGQYVCISDTCCPPSTPSTCNDNALNCQQFLAYCNSPCYGMCMQQHCPSSCGVC